MQHLDFGVIGDVGYGKTAMVTRMTSNYFVEKCDSTNTINLDSLLFSSILVQIRFWDCSGNKSTFPMCLSRLQKCDVIIIVFSNWENTLNWLNLVNNQLKNLNAQICLVITKIDVQDNVKRQMSKEFALQYNLMYFETSAKLNYGLERMIWNLTNLQLEKVNQRMLKLELEQDELHDVYLRDNVEFRPIICPRCILL